MSRTETLAYLGPEGSFTHEAALRVKTNQRYRNLQLVQSDKITEYCKSVAEGKIDYGITPIENSTDGPVAETLLAFKKHPLYVWLEYSGPIRQGLYYRRDADPLTIKCCISKDSANGQCRGNVSRILPAAIFETRNSTVAALLEAAENPDMAAIAPLGAGDVQNLMDKMVRIDDVHDDPMNATRFWLFGAHENDAPVAGKDKTSIIAQMPDSPGALYKALDAFVEKGINLAKIKSFGREGNNIAFLMTLQGHQKDLPLRSAVDKLFKQGIVIKMLGSYPESDYQPPDPEREIRIEYAIEKLKRETSNGINHGDKTVVAFTLKDKVGALRNALQPFQKRRITLAEIDSLPTGKLGEYVFYLAFENGVHQRIQALKELTAQCTKVVLL